MGLWMFGSGGPFRPDLAVMHCLAPDYKKIDDTRSRLDLVEMHWLAPASAAPLRRAAQDVPPIIHSAHFYQPNRTTSI